MIYETETWLQVVLVTIVIGGGAAALAGRAIAATWRPYWHAVGYMFLLGAAVRFVHFALFDAELISLPSYLVDTLYLVVVGSIAWRLTRTNQMVRQYAWLYERSGPFSWRERTGQKTQKNSAAG